MEPSTTTLPVSFANAGILMQSCGEQCINATLNLASSMIKDFFGAFAKTCGQECAKDLYPIISEYIIANAPWLLGLLGAVGLSVLIWYILTHL